MPDLHDLNTYDYHLPQELIAQFPLQQRSASRMMHLNKNSGQIHHRIFSDIVDMLESGEVLVINSSRVIPARLYGAKENGTPVEILLLNRAEGSIWKCLASPGKRVKTEQMLEFTPNLHGRIYRTPEEGIFEIAFVEADYWREIERVGHMPLPPYIKRNDEDADKARYQTVYARDPGSVAAPTAGLHFTPEILEALRNKGVKVCEVILHVGMGTFLPVKCEDITQHKMHSEFCTLPQETAQVVNAAKLTGKRVIAVGSTSLRTLESFWESGELHSGSAWTDIFIYPGKSIQVADALVTNFHLPKSSLLMMISALAGIELIKKAYLEAVESKYRFFSYGDAMFIT